MRTLAFLLSRNSPLYRLLRNPTPLPFFFSHTAPSSSSQQSLHDFPSIPNPNPNPPESLSSRFLEPIPADSAPAHPATEEEEDASMNEFLSRFVWAIRGMLSEAYPNLPRDTRDAMLLVICQKVAAQVDSGAGAGAGAAGDSLVDLSEDLWRTIWEVSSSVHEAMRRDRVRAELRKYLHCDEVKQMCRFAGDVGIRGDFLRELRFKWAREKLEEVDFYLELNRIRDETKKAEDMEKGMIEASEKEKKDVMLKVTALPQRKGKIKYNIHGLDMSDPKWVEVSQRLEEAEKHIVPEEVQPVVGKSKRVEGKIMGLDPKKYDLELVLKDFAEALSAKRADWLALLDRVKQHNEDLYLKVAELLLDEQTFDPNIRDYEKLIDAHFKADRLQDAERTLSKMLEKGIQPDVLTSILLVHMYSKAGNLDRTKEAFEKLRKEDFQPDLRVYYSMITAYVNAGIPKQGETLIREMEGRDVKPTREMYMQVLQAFAQSGQVDGAQRMVNTMQFAGIQPTLESYRLLIETCSRAGDPDQARGHFGHMIMTGLKPDDRCTASMVAAYVKKNLLDKALELLLTLEKDGFKPGIATNTILVDWMGKLQLVEEAEMLLRKIKETDEPPLEVYISLCDMYSRAGNEQRVHQSLMILEERKDLLKADQFERIVDGLLACELHNDARRLFELMQQQGFSPSEHIKVSIKSALSLACEKPAKKKVGKDQW